MLARVAENMYWLSRYLERAENTVRLIQVHSNLLMDLPGLDDHQSWIPLISINGLDKEFAEVHVSATETSVNHFLLTDRDNPGSLINDFAAIQANLRSCRDIIPKTSYESINSLCRLVSREVESVYAQPSHRLVFLRDVEDRLQSISGSLNSNMSHDLAYRVMRMGCYLERADMTSRVIDVQSTRLSANYSSGELIAIQNQRWVAVLRTLVAHQMYRQQLRRPVNGPDTLAFLLSDPGLPRSYAFCLNHLDDSFRKVGGSEAPRKAVAALQQKLDSAVYPTLANDPEKLHEFLDDLQLGMLDVSAALSTAYFQSQDTVADDESGIDQETAVLETSV